MYLVREHTDFVNRLLGSTSRRAMAIALVGIGLVLAALGLLSLRVGAPAMNGRPWDVPLSLDGGWRILNGQVPHRDFFSHVGAFPYYVTWVGMRLKGPCASAIVYGNVTLMALMGVTAFWISRRRTSAFYALLLGIFYGLLVLTPRPLGDPHDYIDYAMLYNRFGEAFLGLFALLLFVSPHPDRRSSWLDAVDAALAGLLLTITWFIKLNYFGVAVVLFGLAALFGFLRPREVLICCASALVFLGLLLAVTGIPLGAMYADFRRIGGAQSLGSRISTLAMQSTKYFLLLPILLLVTWEETKGAQLTSSWRATLRYWVMSLAVFSGALLILTTNDQIGEMPLLLVPAVYGAEMIRRQSKDSGAEPFFAAARGLGAMCLVLFFLLPTLGTDCKALRNVVWAGLRKNYLTTETLRSTRLSDFRFFRAGSRLPYSERYMEELDDGINLLRRHADPDMRLAVARFSNPYHVALGLRPAHGGWMTTAPNTMTRRSHPPLRQALSDANYILALPGCEDMKAVYGAEWDALGLETVEETRFFSLVKLKPGKVAALP